MQRYKKNAETWIISSKKMEFVNFFVFLQRIMDKIGVIKQGKDMKRVMILAVLMVFGMAIEVSAQLPSVTLKDINGKTVTTDTLSNGGNPMIISFFATWCKPCNRELDAISEVYEEWQEETGVKLVAISIDQAQNMNKVKPLVDQHEWPFETVLLDPNGEFKRQLGIQMIPYVLIVDGQGKIVYKHNGYTDGAEEELIEKIRSMALASDVEGN